MKDIQAFLSHFRRQRGWTRQILAAIPDEHFDWAPSDKDFSLGGLVRHLMQAEVFWVKMLAQAVAGGHYDPFSKLPGEVGAERVEAFRGPNVAASRDASLGASWAELLERWEKLSERTEEELGKLRPEDFDTSVRHPLTGMEAPLWEMLLVLLEHEAHHRGQLSGYLKTLGVPQPAVLATS